MENKEIETKFFDLAQQKLEENIFNMWVRPIQIKIEENNFNLIVKNRFFKDWIVKNYQTIFLEILHEISAKKKYILKIEIDKQKESKRNKVHLSTPVKKRSKKSRSVSIGSKLIEEYTFKNFVEGDSNQFALNAAKEVAQKIGTAHNPLYIYGETALGKTHLMTAIGHAVLEKDSDKKVCFISAADFAQEMSNAIKTSQMNDFKNKYRSLDVLLIDDIQFFAGKTKSMEEFFYTFNSLFESQSQIVLTSDKFPKETDLDSRLKSRLNWGLSVPVLPPKFETRKEILIKKAQMQEKELSDEVASYMAKKIESHVRDLEGALKKVIAFSNFTNNPITIEMINNQLKDLFTAQKNQIGIDNIQKIVADYFKISILEMIGKNRSKKVVRPRQIAMSLAKEFTDYSLPEIGKNFGNRDHTTVINAIKRVKELSEKEKSFKDDLENLKRKLRS